MKQIHSSYDDSEMTETTVASGKVFVDFSTNVPRNVLYAAACRDGYENGEGAAIVGNYQELHYEAICTNSAMGFEEAIVVSGHPRCYSPYCTEEDYPELLQDFAIQLMQERANEEEGTTAWVCSGEEETKVSSLHKWP
jgi:hypothetical protein